MFLLPATLAQLAPKLERELRPGATVISYVWPLPGWQPATIDTSRPEAPTLYAYRIATDPQKTPLREKM